MEKVEQVVADSLNVVQANENGIAETLTTKANEYNLTISDALLTPWRDGSIAITDYQTTFDTAASSTWDQLDGIHNKWREIIDDMNEAADIDVSNINAENTSYAPLKQNDKTTSSGSSGDNGTKGGNDSGTSKPELKTGSYVEVKPNTKWYANSFGGGAWGNARSGKILYVNEKGSHPYNIEGLGWVRKEDIVGYAKGTTGVKEDQFAWIDEMGLEELVMHADSNGKLAFLSKGSAVIPHDITENLMELGQLDPSEILSRSAPQIGMSPSVVNNNTEIHIDASVGELIHVDRLDGNNLDEIGKFVDKAWDKKMQTLNNSIRKFTR